jgi:hypothetical protein
VKNSMQFVPDQVVPNLNARILVAVRVLVALVLIILIKDVNG